MQSEKQPRPWPIGFHSGLLFFFAVGMVCLWMLPVVLMGYPFALPPSITDARLFVATGVIDPATSRMLVLLLAALHYVFAWDNVIAWLFVSATGMGCALCVWWALIRRLFDAGVAWISAIILGLFPMYWVIALRLDGYTFALCALFLCIGSVLWLHSSMRIPALILGGLFFGVVLGFVQAFTAILPWMLVGYAWHYRRTPKRAGVGIVVFCISAYIAFAAGLLPNAMQPGLSPAERVAVLMPSLGRGTPGVGHLYPDLYAYEFLRAESEARIAARVENASFLERQADANYRWIFGVGSFRVLDPLVNGAWLTLNAIPDYFFLETVGGAYLWIFIIAGIIVVRKRMPKLLWQLLWMALSMEFLLRFVLHFHRSHLMDIGWMLALFAGVGVMPIADAMSASWKRSSRMLLLWMIVGVTCLGMLQVNRKHLAWLYARSTVPAAYAFRSTLESLPQGSVIAHPRLDDLLFFSPVPLVALHPDTIDLLIEKNAVRDPFRRYHISHIVGYAPQQVSAIRRAVPGIRVLREPESGATPPISPLVQYILHIVR